jgi:hypothetical protein
MTTRTRHQAKDNLVDSAREWQGTSPCLDHSHFESNSNTYEESIMLSLTSLVGPGQVVEQKARDLIKTMVQSLTFKSTSALRPTAERPHRRSSHVLGVQR